MVNKLDNLMEKAPGTLIGLERQENELSKRKRPELDEQEWEIVSRAVQESLEKHKTIALTMFDAFEDLQVIGVVERVGSPESAHSNGWRVVCNGGYCGGG